MTRDSRGIVRDPALADEFADRVLRYSLRPGATKSWMASYALMGSEQNLGHQLRKSIVVVARYLRQPVEWIEALTLDEFYAWGEVLAEVLREEHGARDGDKPRDPYGMLRTDD